MARMAGEFAGMVHFEVPRENADALAAALRTLDSSGLHVAIAQSAGAAQPGTPRGMGLELVGNDRPGIVANLTRLLAERGISIENMHTELIGGAAGAGHRFKVAAHLLVPTAISTEDLRRELGVLASEMMLDIALGERPPREA